MTKEELYLKTIFCCIACDGDIATEEIKMVRSLCVGNELFRNIDSEKLLNSWIVEINEHGGSFLLSYLKEINTVELNEKEQLMLISFAIEAIEADKRIEYAEVKFFKKIRSRLTISDEAILAKHPDKEDFLMPDINVTEILDWNEDTKFNQISIPKVQDN